MVLVKINGVNVCNVNNWDSALRVCAEHYRNGVSVTGMEIISNRGDCLPVIIKHLTI